MAPAGSSGRNNAGLRAIHWRMHLLLSPELANVYYVGGGGLLLIIIILVLLLR